MNQRHTLAVTAGAATLLAAFPMSTIFQSFTWFFYAAMAIIVVTGTAIGVRALRGPVWAQVIAMLGGLLLFSTLVFPSGGELVGVIPSGATFVHFNDLLVAAGGQIRNEAPPVPDLEGLLLLTTVGIGLVAILVDLAAVGLRRKDAVARHFARDAADFRIIFPEPRALFRGHRTILRRNRKIRRALKHRQLFRLFGNDRDGLNAR